MAETPQLHAALDPLAFLLGTWQGSGHGDYPTIEAFAYRETASYTHVGKPFIIYSQRTHDALTGAPLHTETGYLRPVSPSRCELVLSQPSGIVEMHEVVVSGSSLDMSTTAVLGTATAKPAAGVRRHIAVQHDVMNYTLEMAAMGLEMQFHLSAELRRA
jgi:hypothetical protein